MARYRRKQHGGVKKQHREEWIVKFCKPKKILDNLCIPCIINLHKEDISHLVCKTHQTEILSELSASDINYSLEMEPITFSQASFA